MERITITHLARNLADVVNRVFYRGERFTVLRGDRPVMELVPTPRGRRLGDLGSILERIPRLTAEEATALEEDLEASRKALTPPEDSWAS